MTHPLHHNCLLCSSPILSKLEAYRHAYLVKCANCGFVFSSKIPTDAELSSYYSYSRRSTVSPLTINRYNEILDIFESYRKTNTILDIGCSNGYFLAVANKRGWLTYGTELTDDTIEVCSNKGIKMQKGVLNPEHYKNIEFDVVCSFEIIEHINNPVEEMKNIKRILRTGGVFYFTTPNFNSISRRLLQKKWSIIVYPEHLCYYTPKTADYLLKKNSFSKLKLITTGFSISRMSKVLRFQKVKKIALANTDEILRNKMEENIFLHFMKISVNALLILLKIGDTLKGFYQKK